MDRRNVIVRMAAAAAAPVVAMIPAQALVASPSIRDRTYIAYKINVLWNELIASYQEVEAATKIPDIDGFSKALDRVHKAEGAVRSFALSKEV